MKNRVENGEVTQLREQLENATERVEDLISWQAGLQDELTTALEAIAPGSEGGQTSVPAGTHEERRHINELQIRLKRLHESADDFRDVIHALKQELASALLSAIELHQTEVEADSELGGEA